MADWSHGRFHPRMLNSVVPSLGTQFIPFRFRALPCRAFLCRRFAAGSSYEAGLIH